VTFSLPKVRDTGQISQIAVITPSLGIISLHSALVWSGELTTKISTSMTAHAIPAASTHFPHSRHSYRARAGPDLGGFHGGGPSANRCANRWSAQRIMLCPNAMLNPR
jgi:hypothetical protein